MHWFKKSTTSTVAERNQAVDPATSFPDGIDVWHDPPNAKVDICFIHGLTGDRNDTWTAQQQPEPWPKSLLVAKLGDARILTYGYDAYVLRASVASSNKLIDHATNLLSDLASDRVVSNASSRPLIFVCHSLGGLVCKKAILLSRINPEPHLRDIFDSLKGVLFMGTPHKGSWIAGWSKIPASCLGVVKSTNKNILTVLKTDDQLLEAIQRDFLGMLRQMGEEQQRIQITCFFEELPLVGAGLVVTKDSATFEGYTPLSIHANHSNMVKFSSDQDTGFKRVAGELMRWTSQLRIQRQELGQKDLSFMESLLVTNPLHEMQRILDEKGGLLPGAFSWVLTNEDFQQWQTNEQSRMIWIKGDPGKGKTMLLCGIIENLQSHAPDTPLTCFFCQESNSKINSAAAVLRGLIYMLLNSQRHIISEMRREYGHVIKSLSDDTSCIIQLTEILNSALLHPSLGKVYVIIDGLDECKKDLSQLLSAIRKISSQTPQVKWIVSSRNALKIGEQLKLMRDEKVVLSLEINHAAIAASVSTYINARVDELSLLKDYDRATKDAVRDYLTDNANDTFLWVSLVCKQLQGINIAVVDKLTDFPPGLDDFYQRMLNEALSEGGDLCHSIFKLMLTAYRPLALIELASLVTELQNTSIQEQIRAIQCCASFLSLRKNTVSFIHQSAKDFLSKSGIPKAHEVALSNSLAIMSRTLKYNMLDINHPGMLIDESHLKLDGLAAGLYSCTFWVDHAVDLIADAPHAEVAVYITKYLGEVYDFLRQYLLYWFESLAILKKTSEGDRAITRLLAISWHYQSSVPRESRHHDPPETKDWYDSYMLLIRSASSTLLYGGWIMERAPLQIYGGALIFSPENEPIWNVLYSQRFPFIKRVDGYTAPFATALEGHTETVDAVAFSADSNILASCSGDGTVRIWNIFAGLCAKTFTNYKSLSGLVTLSPAGDMVSYPCLNGTIEVRDTTSGRCIQVLERCHGLSVLKFSPDGKTVALGFQNGTVRLWDVFTDSNLVLKASESAAPACALDFASDKKTLAVCLKNDSIEVWSTDTGQRQKTMAFKNCTSVQFWCSSKELTILSDDGVVSQIDTTTWRSKFHPYWYSIGLWTTWWPWYSYSGSTKPKAVMAFGTVPPACAATSLAGRGIWIHPWPRDRYHVASSDLLSDIHLLSFSPDGTKLLSCHEDRIIRIWDRLYGGEGPLTTGEGFLARAESPIIGHAFAPNGTMFATLHLSGRVRITRLWPRDERLLSTRFPGNLALAFSPDSRFLALASPPGNIEIHSLEQGTVRSWTREGEDQETMALVFLDNDTLAFADSKTNQVGTLLFKSDELSTPAVTNAVVEEYPFEHLPFENRVFEAANGEDGPRSKPPRFLMRGSRFVAMDWGYLLREDPSTTSELGLQRRMLVKNDWLELDGKGLIWLPPNCRPVSAAIHQDVIVLGQGTGFDLLIRFDLSRLPT
ncbi:hypothetical protein FOVG_18111 [Fusarium oxysporum f. sp. pisi HDV247]|uniref:NACHT domain-containing protein n=1 Tax=Fusarium oxysporum f. sp. pisi HDV247 TaxID=1080344 RepID=W9NKH3_FUSOX|nr:hypothetical protein FOVG_18111 [Fusarium oxysporum f. sp. pisi HDV247]